MLVLGEWPSAIDWIAIALISVGMIVTAHGDVIAGGGRERAALTGHEIVSRQ
jgi:drug/metabolite transporter (DMT)-like permease